MGTQLPQHSSPADVEVVMHSDELVWVRRLGVSIILGALFMLVLSGPAPAATWLVANNGTDAPGCGSTTACRSITQAIANAAAGDKIVVGPGRYGDLNGNGHLTDPGDENSTVAGKLIVIGKSVTITSRDGAGTTMLTSGTLSGETLVSIEANGVVFGGTGKGFFVYGNGGSSTTGIATAPTTSGVTVAGNVVFARAADMQIDGTGHTVKNNVVFGLLDLVGSAHTVTNNVAEGGSFQTDPGSSNLALTGNRALLGNTPGFNLQGSGHVLKNNLASNMDSDGFSCSGTCTALQLIRNIARHCTGRGFLFQSGTNHVVTENLAGNNGGNGFEANATSAMAVTFSGNEAVGNSMSGFLFDTSAVQPTLTGNVVVGNIGVGIGINGAGTITANSIYGNDTVGNCGISLTGSGTVTATRNFWGAASGPGADPADLSCPGTGTIDAGSPSATEFKANAPKVP
jgi:hypothetical protein